MRRTLLYDQRTGEILHSHYVVSVVESPDGGAALSDPAAASMDAELAELVTRGLDPQQLGSVTTSATIQSSRRVGRRVDSETGKLRSRRVDGTPSPESDED